MLCFKLPTQKYFKMIPLKCIVHPFCAWFFAWLARVQAQAQARAHLELNRCSMKTEFFREINGRFLLMEQGDPHFLLYKFNQDSVPNAI